MSLWNDWLDLAGSTVRSIEKRHVSDLYALEWPEARKRLTEDHTAEIQRHPQQHKQWLMTVASVLYGLTKRLVPQRRLMFLLAMVLVLEAMAVIAFGREPVILWSVGSLLTSVLLLTLLLAMELIDKINFRDELELARDLQADLLPTQLPEHESLELEAFNQIANTVGGDIYDFVILPDGQMAVLFGDASGHGMAAGLVMAVAHAAFRTQLDIDPSPEPMFATLNRILCRTGGPRSFFAGVYLLIDRQGAFSAIVAGHPPVLKITPDCKVEQSFGQGSYPLGIKSPLSWTVEHGRIEPGSTLLLYSDGLAEGRNCDEQAFGFDRVQRVAEQNAHRSARELLNNLLGDFRAFIGWRHPEDDVTIAVIRRKN